MRISLSAHIGVEPKISLYDEDGSPALEISSCEKDSKSRRITFFGKAQQWRMQITCNNNGSGVTLYDQDGEYVQTLIFRKEEELPPDDKSE